MLGRGQDKIKQLGRRQDVIRILGGGQDKIKKLGRRKD